MDNGSTRQTVPTWTFEQYHEVEWATKVTEIRCWLPKLCFRHYRFVKSVVSASGFFCTRSCLSCKILLVIRNGMYTQKQQTKHCIDCSMKNVFPSKVSWKRLQWLSVWCTSQAEWSSGAKLLTERITSFLFKPRYTRSQNVQGRGRKGGSWRLT